MTRIRIHQVLGERMLADLRRLIDAEGYGPIAKRAGMSKATLFRVMQRGEATPSDAAKLHIMLRREKDGK